MHSNHFESDSYYYTPAMCEKVYSNIALSTHCMPIMPGGKLTTDTCSLETCSCFKILQGNADYGRMVAEMDTNEHAFDVNAPGERPWHQI